MRQGRTIVTQRGKGKGKGKLQQRSFFAHWNEQQISRRMDPGTSRAAAERVQPKLDGLRAEFVRRLRSLNVPSTAYEIAAGNESIRKRAAECVRLGLVRVAGERRCQVTGNVCRVFEVI